MADETILIDIEYNTDEAEKEVDSLTESIEGLKVAQAQLKEQTEKGTVSQKEGAKQNEKLKVQLQSENKQRKDLIKIMQSEKGSRDQMRQSISQLIRQRNALSTSTKQGRNEAKKLEKQINKLDKAYQKNGTNTEKAKGNIGKYGQAMNGLPGPINGVIQSMKLLAKVIFATPLGWLIGLIAGAGVALKTFFTGSAEGQERWNKTMNRAKGVMSVFKDELIKIGKGISDFTTNLKNSDEGVKGWAKSVGEKAQGAWKNLKKDVEDKGLWTALKDNASDAVDAVTNKFDELGQAIDENAARADAIAEQQNQLRRDEIATLTDLAILRRDIAEARAQASDREGLSATQRLEFLDLAIEKENEILVIEENLAAERVKIQQLQMAQGENTLEDYEKLAQLEQAQIDLETTNARARRKIQSERQTTLREVAAEQQAIKAEEQEIVNFERQLELEQEAEQKALLLEINQEYDTALAESNKEAKEKIIEDDKAAAEMRVEIAKAAIQATDQLAGQSAAFLNTLNQARFDSKLASLEKENLTEFEFAKRKEKLERDFAKKSQRIAIAQAIAKAALVILNASLTQPYIPAGLAASAAAAISTGIQIATIKNAKFAKGGVLPLAKNGMKMGTFSGPSHSQGGTPIVNGLTGQPIAEVEGNENFYVVNKQASAHINSLSDINQRIGGGVPLSNKSQHMADGGRADIETSQGGFNISDITKEVVDRLPPIIVRTEDIKTGVQDYDDVVNVGVV